IGARNAGDARTAVVDGRISEPPGRKGQPTAIRDPDPAAEGSQIVHGGVCGDRISKRIGGEARTTQVQALEVGFSSEHQPTILPIVADLSAADHGAAVRPKAAKVASCVERSPREFWRQWLNGSRYQVSGES